MMERASKRIDETESGSAIGGHWLDTVGVRVRKWKGACIGGERLASDAVFESAHKAAASFTRYSRYEATSTINVRDRAPVDFGAHQHPLLLPRTSLYHGSALHSSSLRPSGMEAAEEHGV